MNQQYILRTFFGCILISILIVIDQVTKVFAVENLMDKPDYIIIDGVLQLHYLENTGGAFSFLTGNIPFFIVVTSVICIFIVFILFRLPHTKRILPLWICLIFLLSGAIGNLIDRITLGYVVDFIYFSLIDFPVFNVADIYVTVDIFVLAFLIIFFYKEEELNGIFSLKNKNGRN